ncbi:hypothetical protein ACSBR2_013430 [Camellia fascicularis]
MEKPSLVALRREVSEDEIQVARNFLIQRYGGPNRVLMQLNQPIMVHSQEDNSDKFCMV